MAANNTRWAGEAHESLCIALYMAIVEMGGSAQAQKETIERVMTNRGHTFSWEAIR